ncbi:MAG: antitoxin Xre/MbcA/ParS toxin-binding domain-containing protein, partial [Candidatus Binatia bacterium]
MIGRSGTNSLNRLRGDRGRREATGAAQARSVRGQVLRRWIDEPLPALDGDTPREAARTKAGRNRVDTLLKEMQNFEARLP